MITVSVSQLKANPAKVIEASSDYPVEVQSRSKTRAFVIGDELYRKLEAVIEDYIDSDSIRKTDFSRGRDFEDLAGELGV